MTGSDDILYFAIGDVHGESEKLAALHDAILDRIALEGAPARIVHLGDYVDRGPDSRGVVERVMRLQDATADNPAVDVHALLGNHERMMLDAIDSAFLSSFEHWSVNGGRAALESYGLGHVREPEDARRALPADHLDWLRRLPTIFHDEDRRIAFVHGGIDPGAFPGCSEQVRLWTRSRKFFDSAAWPERPELDGLLVVHGHTPTSDFAPDIQARRINIDTGACFGGPLSAVMLKPGEDPSFIFTAR